MSIQEQYNDSNSIYITVSIHKKTFVISVGDGTQRVKWLGHVAIARWDEENNLGWKWLGNTSLTIISHLFKLYF